MLTNGSLQAPRQVRHNPRTIKAHILGTEAIIHAWADAGFQSFAEVTRADVVAALEATTTSRRHIAGNGLKSLFTTLKGHRLIFANPTRGMKASPKSSNIPLALDAAVIREELNCPNPVAALAVALVAFHALTGKQLCELRLTDISDGHLILDNRDIPLERRCDPPGDVARPAEPNLAEQRQPPPVHQPAYRTQAPACRSELSLDRAGYLRPRALREDHILHEIHATGGDVRRICDLFGLSVEGATRYLSTVEHPDLARSDAQVP